MATPVAKLVQGGPVQVDGLEIGRVSDPAFENMEVMVEEEPDLPQVASEVRHGE